MINDIPGYIFNVRFLLILLAMFLLIANDFRAYRKDKKVDTQNIGFENDHRDMKEKLTLIESTLAIATGKWETIDLSKGVPPVVSNAAFLLFRSSGGVVKGYIKGAGYSEQYPFDTSINDSMPITIQIKEPKAQYTITYPKDHEANLSIFVTGYRINR